MSKSAAIIIIGNEILSGRTQDTNVKFIAEKLGKIGITIKEVRVIPDIEEKIVKTVNEMRPNFEYIFTTGGIGPTHDDITTESVAKAFGVKIYRNDEAVASLRSHHEEARLSDARLRMADVPEGAELINNPATGAPGYRMENVYVLAGIPFVMQAMIEALIPQLRGGDIIKSRTVAVYYPESMMAESYRDLQTKHPEVEMGSYPFVKNHVWGSELVLKSEIEEKLEIAYRDVLVYVKSLKVNFEEK